MAGVSHQRLGGEFPGSSRSLSPRLRTSCGSSLVQGWWKCLAMERQQAVVMPCNLSQQPGRCTLILGFGRAYRLGPPAWRSPLPARRRCCSSGKPSCCASTPQRNQAADQRDESIVGGLDSADHRFGCAVLVSQEWQRERNSSA